MIVLRAASSRELQYFMDESALDLEDIALSPQKETVRVFYKELWDHADKSLIPRIFHDGFTFRGSLGPALVGHDQFASYVDRVTGAFGQYTTDILAMIEEGNRVSGKMRFHGFHRKELFDVPPSGRHVWWTGMPILGSPPAASHGQKSGQLRPSVECSQFAANTIRTAACHTQEFPVLARNPMRISFHRNSKKKMGSIFSGKRTAKNDISQRPVRKALIIPRSVALA